MLAFPPPACPPSFHKGASMLTFPPTQTASKGVVRGRSMPDMGPFVAPGHALRGRMGSKVEAHAYMESKGVPQLLDSVLKQLILERPDDAVEFMREVLRKSSAEMEAGGAEGDQEAEWAEAGAAAAGGGGDRAQTPGKRAVGTLRVHAEFTDARGAVTQMHLFRVSFPSSTEP
ncbi:hypothetical protein T484DRAFT_2275224 [Baffinella frigidus]|nr:hypothetical protein T484DRAFT_2275224 [Cryptophyta sp. CCMP2293]